MTDKQFQNEAKSKRIDVPQPRKRIGKDLGVPKLKGLQRAVDAKAARAARVRHVRIMHTVSVSDRLINFIIVPKRVKLEMSKRSPT